MLLRAGAQHMFWCVALGFRKSRLMQLQNSDGFMAAAAGTFVLEALQAVCVQLQASGCCRFYGVASLQPANSITAVCSKC
jgi:hypothetical protein